eukprot:c27932_g1_i2 orf=109-384(-)
MKLRKVCPSDSWQCRSSNQNLSTGNMKLHVRISKIPSFSPLYNFCSSRSSNFPYLHTEDTSKSQQRQALINHNSPAWLAGTLKLLTKLQDP